MKKHAQLWISYQVDKFRSKNNQLISFGQRFGCRLNFLWIKNQQTVQRNYETFKIWNEMNTICAFENKLIGMGFTNWWMVYLK